MSDIKHVDCPYCLEEVEANAVRCIHCDSKLEQNNSNEPTKIETEPPPSKKPTKKPGKGSSIFDVLKVKDFKQQIEVLSERNEYLQVKLEEVGAMDIVQKEGLIKEINSKIIATEAAREKIQADIEQAQIMLNNLTAELVITEEELLLQSFGLYKPVYEFTNSEQYKSKLDDIRQLQKELIKKGLAASGNMGWSVNGNAAQGKRMVKDMQKLLIRAFNSECETTISKVKYNNFDASVKRITKARDAISKLGNIMGVAITQQYFQLKIDELHLAFEYQQIKQQEKEEQKELREWMREEAKLQKEIEEARKKVEKEKNHFLNALAGIAEQLENATDNDRGELLKKKAELESSLEEISEQLKDIDYREANQKAGYVYVVSNIGSFGENVYKIGVTRRLDPYERVSELGDASVPFNFDCHTMVFCDDAFSLETALHKAFDDRKINMVNPRREFFAVGLDEIKEVIRVNYDKTVEFIDLPEAEQYRLSQKMKNELTFR